MNCVTSVTINNTCTPITRGVSIENAKMVQLNCVTSVTINKTYTSTTGTVSIVEPPPLSSDSQHNKPVRARS